MRLHLVARVLATVCCQGLLATGCNLLPGNENATDLGPLPPGTPSSAAAFVGNWGGNYWRQMNLNGDYNQTFHISIGLDAASPSGWSLCGNVHPGLGASECSQYLILPTRFDARVGPNNVNCSSEGFGAYDDAPTAYFYESQHELELPFFMYMPVACSYPSDWWTVAPTILNMSLVSDNVMLVVAAHNAFATRDVFPLARESAPDNCSNDADCNPTGEGLMQRCMTTAGSHKQCVPSLCRRSSAEAEPFCIDGPNPGLSQCQEVTIAGVGVSQCYVAPKCLAGRIDRLDSCGDMRCIVRPGFQADTFNKCVTTIVGQGRRFCDAYTYCCQPRTNSANSGNDGLRPGEAELCGTGTSPACPAGMDRCHTAFETPVIEYCSIGKTYPVSCLVTANPHHATDISMYRNCLQTGYGINNKPADRVECCAQRYGLMRAYYDSVTMMSIDEANYPDCPL